MPSHYRLTKPDKRSHSRALATILLVAQNDKAPDQVSGCRESNPKVQPRAFPFDASQQNDLPLEHFINFWDL